MQAAISTIVAIQLTAPMTETPTLNTTSMNDLSEAVLHVNSRNVFEVSSNQEIKAM